jgi:ABC-type transport system substrate-binding protein
MRSSRRSFLRRGAAFTAAGAAWLAGCGESVPRNAPTPNASPGAAAKPATSRGGILRAYTFDALAPDTLDPHLTHSGPVANMHDAVFSRVLRIADEQSGELAPDLASVLPEQPDDLTYVIRLHEAARFHDTPRVRAALPNVAGRIVTPDDVRFSIERQAVASGSNVNRFHRASLWSAVDSMTIQDPETLVIRLKTPVAAFSAFLASRHAFVIPREIVFGGEARSDLAMIGSGPFVLEAFTVGVGMHLRRNVAWFARDDDPDGLGRGKPFLEGYDAFFTPQSDAFQRAAFDRKAVDATGLADVSALSRALTTNLEDVALDEVDGTSIFAGRFLVDRQPFSDDRLRRAIHLALDRQALGALLYPPLDGRRSSRLSGPIAPASHWALPDDVLRDHPGYGARREDDARTARQLWDSANGPALRPLRVLFAGAPRAVAERAIYAVARQLSDVLGARIEPVIDMSGTALILAGWRRNVEQAADGALALAFSFEDGGGDLDEWLYEFRSGQPANTYGLKDATLDAMLDAQRGEFDSERRLALGADIQDYLLEKANARVEVVAPVERRIRWGYVRNWGLRPTNGAGDALAATWLDRDHPDWQGRPTA